MSSKSSKKVSFSDELVIYSEKDLISLQKENSLLKQKILDLESTQKNSEKFFISSIENLEIFQEMSRRLHDFQILDEKNRIYIQELQGQNKELEKRADQLNNLNSDLSMKKCILEKEVEKLTQLLYNHEVQLKKLTLGKNTCAQNPNYKQADYLSKPEKTRIKQNVEIVCGKKEPRRGGKKKLENKEDQVSTRRTDERRRCYSSIDLRQKEMERSANLEELRRLINQAKEHHIRYKSLF